MLVQISSGAIVLIFGLSLHLLLYFVYSSSAVVLASKQSYLSLSTHLYDRYQSLLYWLIFSFGRSYSSDDNRFLKIVILKKNSMEKFNKDVLISKICKRSKKKVILCQTAQPPKFCLKFYQHQSSIFMFYLLLFYKISGALFFFIADYAKN